MKLKCFVLFCSVMLLGFNARADVSIQTQYLHNRLLSKAIVVGDSTGVLRIPVRFYGNMPTGNDTRTFRWRMVPIKSTVSLGPNLLNKHDTYGHSSFPLVGTFYNSIPVNNVVAGTVYSLTWGADTPRIQWIELNCTVWNINDYNKIRYGTLEILNNTLQMLDYIDMFFVFDSNLGINASLDYYDVLQMRNILGQWNTPLIRQPLSRVIPVPMSSTVRSEIRGPVTSRWDRTMLDGGSDTTPGNYAYTNARLQIVSKQSSVNYFEPLNMWWWPGDHNVILPRRGGSISATNSNGTFLAYPGRTSIPLGAYTRYHWPSSYNENTKIVSYKVEQYLRLASNVTSPTQVSLTGDIPSIVAFDANLSNHLAAKKSYYIFAEYDRLYSAPPGGMGLNFGQIISFPRRIYTGNVYYIEVVNPVVNVMENEGPAVVTLRLLDINSNVVASLASGEQITVNVVTVDGTATSPGDYIGVETTITWNPGDSGTKTISITIEDDDIPEPNEYFTVLFGNPVGGFFRNASPQVMVNIIDDDVYYIDVIDTEINLKEDEGPAVVRLQLLDKNNAIVAPLPPGQQVSVSAFTANGTAIAPEDYTAVATTITWNPGDGQKSISIHIVDDGIPEPDEYFTVNFNNSVGAALKIPMPQTRVNILGGETEVKIGFTHEKYSVLEGEGVNAQVTVFLSEALPADFTCVLLRQEIGAGPGYATANVDFVAGPLEFVIPGGQTSATALVRILDDFLVEENEVFLVRFDLTASQANMPPNHTLSVDAEKETALVEILDNDYELVFDPPAYTVLENAEVIQLTARIQPPLPEAMREAAISLEAVPQDGTAKGGEDFDNATQVFFINLEEGDSGSFSIPIINDDVIEDTEFFTVNLRVPDEAAAVFHGKKLDLHVSADLGTAIVTILDDDAYNISFTEELFSCIESDGEVAVTVTLDRDPAHQVRGVRWHAVEGGVQDHARQMLASLTEDIVIPPLNQTELIWNIGDPREKTFKISVVDDNKLEMEERFRVALSVDAGVSRVRVTDQLARVAIFDDEKVTFSIVHAFYEKDMDNNPMGGLIATSETLTSWVKVVRKPDDVELAYDFQVSLVLNGGSAVYGEDYTATPGQILAQTFGPSFPGRREGIINLLAVERLDNGVDTVGVNLTAVVTGVVLETPGEIKIKRDRIPLKVQVSKKTGVTSEDGTTDSFYVTLNRPPAGVVGVSIESTDLKEGIVVVPPGGLLFFEPGNWNVGQQVVVKGVPDGIVDGHKRYNVMVTLLDPDK